MPRYILIRAADDGTLTPNPHASPAARRFAGRRVRPRPADAPPDPALSLVDHYEPAAEVLEDHVDLRAAVKAGHLTLTGQCVASSLAAALSTLAPTQVT